MRNRPLHTILVAALALSLLATAGGCSKSSVPKGGPLEDITWELTSYPVSGKMAPVPAKAQFQLGFKQGQVTGQAVNSYSAQYTSTAEGDLKIGQLASTLMMGPAGLMKVEKAYFEALQTAAFYWSDGRKLTMYDKDYNVLLQFAKNESSLTGRVWRATGINNGSGGVVSTSTTPSSTTEFLTDGTMRGSTGANQYSSPYKLGGTDRMQIGPVMANKAAGPPALMKREAEYLAALETVATYKLTGDTLELRTAGGAIAIDVLRDQVAGLAGGGPPELAPTRPDPASRWAAG